MDVGQKVKELRKSLGMSSTELSARSGIAQSFISKVERGLAYPTTDTLEKLVSAFNISLSDFFSSNDSPLSPDTVKIMEVIQQLPQEERQALLNYLQTRLKN